MGYSKVNLNEYVYDSLKTMIIEGKFEPGEKLIEGELSELFNVSRTPIREALRRLEKEELVTLAPSRKAEVTKLSKKTMIDLYHCRSVLEGLAVRQAVDHIAKEDIEQLEESIYLSNFYYKKGDIENTVKKTTFFHEKLTELSHNRSLITMMETVRTQMLRYRILTGKSVGFRLTAIEEHMSILNAVIQKLPDKAEALMKQHILDDLENYLQGIHSRYLND